ncbi:MAG: OmpA family protein [Mangrovibacterium sp.]
MRISNTTPMLIRRNRHAGFVLMLLLCLNFIGISDALAASAKGDERINKHAKIIEKRADKNFIVGGYEAAFEQYEMVIADLASYPDQWMKTTRKVARLYVLNQDYDNAMRHYEALYKTRPQDLLINDVCNYIDMLRTSGKERQAEIICLNFSYDEQFSENQRFQNTLQSLAQNRYYFNVGGQEYALRPLKNNTEKAEYFADEHEGNAFFILSDSHMKDPNKVFFHNSRFLFVADSLRNKQVFNFIPENFLEGPIAVSRTKEQIVVTVNEYAKRAKISLDEGDADVVKTKLYTSYFDVKKDRWSKFEPMFEKDGYSYAHPMFSEDESCVIFSSNRSGGFGGMDLYISYREGENTWSAPKNLGRLINTEGNEIFPIVKGKQLSFSSNGHVGNGGYDVYEIDFHNITGAVDGTLYHYPHPINSAYNDFALKLDDSGRGYLVSDRRKNFSDDIYAVANIATTNSSSDAEVSSEIQRKYALNGMTRVIEGFNKNKISNEVSFVSTPIDGSTDAESKQYADFIEGELLTTLYFHFDSFELQEEHHAAINALLETLAADDVAEVIVAGFSDKLGSQSYNMKLSHKRAQEVADCILDQVQLSTLTVEGRGRIFLEEASSEEQKSFFILDEELRNNEDAFMKEVAKNQKARKVDIIIKKVKN